MPLNTYGDLEKQSHINELGGETSTPEQSFLDNATQILGNSHDAKVIGLKYAGNLNDTGINIEDSNSIRVIQDFKTIKEQLGELFLNNLLYNPLYNIPLSQVQSLAAELRTIKEPSTYTEQELEDLLGNMSGLGKAETTTGLYDTQRLDISEVEIIAVENANEKTQRQTFLQNKQEAIFQDISALFPDNTSIDKDSIHDMSRGVMNRYNKKVIAYVNQNNSLGKGQTNKTQYTDLLKVSPFNADPNITGLDTGTLQNFFTSLSTAKTLSVGEVPTDTEFSCNVNDLGIQDILDSSLNSFIQGKIPVMQSSGSESNYLDLKTETTQVANEIISLYGTLNNPTPTESALAKVKSGVEMISDVIKKASGPVKEFFTMIKSLFHDIGLGEWFDKETSKDTFFGQIMQAVEMQASSISPTQYAVISNMYNELGIDTTGTELDTDEVMNNMEDYLFDNKEMINQQNIDGLMKGISPEKQQALLTELSDKFKPETGKLDVMDLMVYNMLNETTNKQPQQKFTAYLATKSQNGGGAHEIFITFFSSQRSKREMEGITFGNNTTGSSPNEVFTRSMITSMLVNDAAAKKIRDTRLGTQAAEMSKGEVNQIEGVTLIESPDKQKVTISAHDKPILYSLDGGTIYQTASPSTVPFDIQTSSLARPTTIFIAQPDGTTPSKPHTTFSKSLSLPIEGHEQKQISSTVDLTTNTATVDNLVPKKSYTYKVKYLGEIASAGVTITPEQSTYTIPNSKPVESLELQETGATEFVQVYKRA